jgi:uncharacterized protein (TIGR02145 family)
MPCVLSPTGFKGSFTCFSICFGTNSAEFSEFSGICCFIILDNIFIFSNLCFIIFKKFKMKIKFLPFLMLPILGMAQANSNGEVPLGENTSSERQPLEIKRNAQYNLDEIKVRWKKAALENCQGVPCVSITPPGPVTSVVATPTGPTSARVTFGTPSSDGGSTITGYRVTATPTTTAPGKRKSSGTIIVEGKESPIDITGLSFGVNYTFSVIALNAAGGSTPNVTVTPVTPCTLNTAITVSRETSLNTQDLNEDPITIITRGATGIGTATGLPEGLTAAWSADVITISGTPEESGTFEYKIPLTGGCGSVNATGTITVNPAPTSACPAPIINDIDGNIYNTVSIGTQCWIKENLRVSSYNDGTLIPIVNDNSAWASLNTGGRSWYNNDSTAYEIPYGNLYNWYAVNNSRKLCPSGWHVPNNSDWNKLVKLIDSDADTSTTTDINQSTTAGNLLKKNDPVWINNSGSDYFGFSALPGGSRRNSFTPEGYIFGSITEIANFWSATERFPSASWSISMTNLSGNVFRGSNSKLYGASVRCLKD